MSTWPAIPTSPPRPTPFGSDIYSRGYSAGKYRFGFNGKEEDGETHCFDYGFRIYNPALGRFMSTDPLYKSFPFFTTYQFASNRPIQAIDIDGLEAADANGAIVTNSSETTVPITEITVFADRKRSFWEKTALFAKGFFIGAVISTAITAAVLTIGSPILSIAAGAYGLYQIGKTGYELFTGKRLWSGEKLTQKEKLEEAGALVGGVIGGGVGAKISAKIKVKGKSAEPPKPAVPEQSPAEIIKETSSSRSSSPPTVEVVVDPNVKPAFTWEHMHLLQQAMNKGGFKEVPADFRAISWSEGQYLYTVRGHGAKSTAPAGSNSANGPTYRIARQQIGLDPVSDKPYPLEYLDPVQNKWITVEGLKQNINEPAANNTHIPNKFAPNSR